MIREFAVTVGQINLLILFILNILVVLRYRHLPVELQRILGYLLLSITTECVSRWLFSKYLNNLYLLHIYTFFEILVWSYFYSFLFRAKQWSQTKLPWLLGGIALLIVANSIFLEPTTGFNSNAKTLVQVCLISYVVYYMFISFGKIDLRQPVPRAISMINFAVLFYYSGSLFIFMFSKVLADQGITSKSQFSLWAINALLLVIFHALILISLWTVAFRKTTSS